MDPKRLFLYPYFFISFILKYSMPKYQRDTFYSCVSQRTLTEGLFTKPLAQSAKQGENPSVSNYRPLLCVLYYITGSRESLLAR